MKSRRFCTLVISLLLCASAQAGTVHTGTVVASMGVDVNLLACHATLAGLTVLGMTLSMRRLPWSRNHARAIRAS